MSAPMKVATGGTCLILTIEDGKLVTGVYTGPGGFVVVDEVKSVDDFTRIAEGNGGHLMVSSSVDFPHEYTRNEDVIRLCRELRS